MSPSRKLIDAICIGVGVTTLTGVSYWLYKQWKENVMPTKWRRVGTLAEIKIFPVKSCAPLALEAGTEIECDVLGAHIHKIRDRCFMLVDENGTMITARVYPKMVLIKSSISSPTKLLLTAPDVSTSLEIDIAKLDEQSTRIFVQTSVFGVDVKAMLCGESYDKWFSLALLQKEVGLRLVYFPYSEPVRAIALNMTKEPFIRKADTGTFNDATSYMLINLASVDELNTQTPQPVDPLQFRGNFYLKMDESIPYAEDKWGWIKIGNDAVFRSVSPCTRCIVPNVNPLNGERDPNHEPLKTLKKYRKRDKYTDPIMGIHLGIRQLGSVKVNDVVYVEDM